MTTPQLFPRPAKRMKQPPKDLLREQLATAANEIIRLRAEKDHLEQRINGARVALEGEQHG